MKIFIVAATVLVALGCIVIAVGYCLPAHRSGRAERIIAAPRANILAVLLDVERQPEWRTDVASIALEGDAWAETTSSGERIRFEWVDRNESHLSLRFQSDRGYKGKWRADFSDVAGGTRIVVEEQAVIENPLSRVIARLMFDPAAFSRRYLDTLAAHVEVRR